VRLWAGSGHDSATAKESIAEHTDALAFLVRALDLKLWN
jgi:hypothetical protein